MSAIAKLTLQNGVGDNGAQRMGLKFTHRGYQLTSVSTRNEDGSYQARVSIVQMNAGAPRSQRFADFERFSEQSGADRRAIEGAKSWIDDQYWVARTTFPTDFATLA